MQSWTGVIFFGCFLLLCGCSSPGWIHPDKRQDEFVNDYNRCENKFDEYEQQEVTITNPSAYTKTLFMERCLRKGGWVPVQR